MLAETKIIKHVFAVRNIARSEFYPCDRFIFDSVLPKQRNCRHIKLNVKHTPVQRCECGWNSSDAPVVHGYLRSLAVLFVHSSYSRFFQQLNLESLRGPQKRSEEHTSELQSHH